MKRYWIFIVLLALALVAGMGCSKRSNPLAPETGENQQDESGVGKLSVSSIPDGAEVFIDGNWWPADDVYTPTNPQDIAVGDHELRVQKAGYKPFVVTVSIESGKLTTMNPYLEKLDDNGGNDPVWPQGCFTLWYKQSENELRFEGEMFGAGIVDTLMLDGSDGPLQSITIHNMTRDGKWYVLDMTSFQYQYTKFTFRYHDIWYYWSVSGCDPSMQYIEVVDEGQWFHLIPPPPPEPEYYLTVNNGSGDGDYSPGANVTISADAPAAGYHFAGWTGDGIYITDPSSMITSVTMPARAAEVTATYEQDNQPAAEKFIETDANKIRLYGPKADIQGWVVVELYAPEANERQEWTNNYWSAGSLKQDSQNRWYMEYDRVAMKYTHGTFYTGSSKLGLQDSGPNYGEGYNSMVGQVLAEYSKGTGIKSLITNPNVPGHFVMYE